MEGPAELGLGSVAPVMGLEAEAEVLMARQALPLQRSPSPEREVLAVLSRSEPSSTVAVVLVQVPKGPWMMGAPGAVEEALDQASSGVEVPREKERRSRVR